MQQSLLAEPYNFCGRSVDGKRLCIDERRNTVVYVKEVDVQMWRIFGGTIFRCLELDKISSRPARARETHKRHKVFDDDLEFRVRKRKVEFRAFRNNRATAQRRRWMSKKRKQQKHAKRRFNERFGVILPKALRQKLVKQIQEGKAKPIRKRSLRITLFELPLNGQDIIVVYDRRRKEIVTGWLKET